MDEKNTFRLDETILQNRKKSAGDPYAPEDSQVYEAVVIEDEDDLGEVIDMDREEGETIHIEIGEMDYDPGKGRWKDSQRGLKAHEPEEIEADYRQLPDRETLSARTLEDKSSRKRIEKRTENKAGKSSAGSTGNRSGRKKGREKPKRDLPLYAQIIYGLLVWACLGFSFLYPYQYLHKMISQASEVPAASEAETAKAPPGTYCTLKSNSLDGVPVYGNPGDTAQIAFIPEGKYVQLRDNTTVDGKAWAQIDYCGITAWIPMKQLHFINDGKNYIRVGSRIYMNSITEKGINLYDSPSPTADVAASGIRYGSEFTVLDLQEGWAQVEYKGNLCWINMFHMGSYGNRHWKVETLSKAQAINLRKEPSQDVGFYCKVPEKQELEILEFKNGWGQVKYDGYTGWVMLHYLTPIEGD
ncbi:MAG: SH3 domain-containing protein [Eubacterium sp.]|nr:SH3 domain-containing protein [Eubacterium sp.]